MKKLTLFIILIVCTIVFTVPAWSKGGKDGDPPVIKTGEAHKILVDIVKDGDPPAPPKDH